MAALLTDTELDRDRHLVESHQAGDASAFGQLYQLHYARLVRFCQRKVRDAHLAEEIAQETFLKAYRGMPALEGGRRFYPWLTVIASRLVIDHHRRAARVEPAALVDPGTIDDIHEDLDRQVDREQILLALQRVRVRHREVLTLRDYEDLSYEAIAERLGTSPTVVQSLLHRARAALRREYLAVVEATAAFPVVAPLAALLRRLRHRAGRLAAWVPDAGSLGAPLAAATIAITGVIAGTAPASPPVVTVSAQRPQPAQPMPQAATLSPNALPAAATVGAPAAAAPAAPAAPPPAEVWLGPQGAAQARAHGSQMPARIDSGLGMVALDPHVILDDTVQAASGLLGGN